MARQPDADGNVRSIQWHTVRKKAERKKASTCRPVNTASNGLACRPKKVAKRVTKKEAQKKTDPARVKWSVTASGKKRKK